MADRFLSQILTLRTSLGTEKELETIVKQIAALKDKRTGRPLAAVSRGMTEAEEEQAAMEDGENFSGWSFMLDAAADFEGSISDFIAVVDSAIRAAEEAKEKERQSKEELNAMDAVTLTTAHSSKGRQWPNVFVIQFNDGVWPNLRAINERGPEGEAEERRLTYVAVTRAQQYLSITTAKSRPRDTPSRYIGPLIEGEPMELPAPSPHTEAYNEWVDGGCMYGRAPFVIRAKEVK